MTDHAAQFHAARARAASTSFELQEHHRRLSENLSPSLWEFNPRLVARKIEALEAEKALRAAARAYNASADDTAQVRRFLVGELRAAAKALSGKAPAAPAALSAPDAKALAAYVGAACAHSQAVRAFGEGQRDALERVAIAMRTAQEAQRLIVVARNAARLPDAEQLFPQSTAGQLRPIEQPTDARACERLIAWLEQPVEAPTSDPADFEIRKLRAELAAHEGAAS